MDPRETQLLNCLIVPRHDTQRALTGLFEQSPEHGVQCRLDGYAIVPREDYEALVEKAQKWDALPTPDVDPNESAEDLSASSQAIMALWQLGRQLRAR